MDINICRRVVGDVIVIVGRITLEALDGAFFLTNDEDVVDGGLEGTVGVEGLESVGEAVVISDSLLCKVGRDVVRVAETLGKCRLHGFRIVTRVEVADEECGAVIF